MHKHGEWFVLAGGLLISCFRKYLDCFWPDFRKCRFSFMFLSGGIKKRDAIKQIRIILICLLTAKEINADADIY